jgi:DNA-binding MarR family transcriptional regulator
MTDGMPHQTTSVDLSNLNAPQRLPLPALLSQVLVAFIIEFDNEFEHQVAHRTTNHGATTGSRHVPWLVSRVMWSNFLQFVDPHGTTIRELRSRLQMPDKNLRIWLTRLVDWWGYLTIESRQAGTAAKRMHPDAVVLATAGGRKALQVWPTLDNMVETRWRERFGKETVDHLRQSSATIANRIDAPDSLPILGYGLFSRGPEPNKQQSTGALANHAGLSLPSLLSRVLLSFAIEFERESDVSLAISANVLRLLTDAEVPLSELPRMAAISKEASAMSLSFLVKRGYVVAKSKPGGTRGKVVLLTPKGNKAKEVYSQRVETIEQQWQALYGERPVALLRESLAQLIGDPPPSSLLCCLEPYPDGWRASLPKPAGLPHYPMILHRGGFPDGS